MDAAFVPNERPDTEQGSPPSGHLPIGSRHYRAFVGPPEKYDIVAAMQFNLLTALGLREHHYLLDIGCGSLRAGRLLIPYLLPGHYFGIEPEKWLLEEGIDCELGRDILRIKAPTFHHDRDFELSVFGRTFDFIIAQSIFSHAPVWQIRHCLSEIQKVATPSSIFAFTFCQGESNYADAAWVYPGCVTYTWDYLREMVVEHGLTCTPIPWSHPNGQRWVGVTRQDFPGAFPVLLAQPFGATNAVEFGV